MRATMDSGCVGREDGDGWVEWQLVDSAWSYNPTLACGTFGLVLGKGTIWGAPSNGHGQLAIVDYTIECPEDAEVAHVDFVWCLDEFLAAVGDALERFDHPAPHNVLDAARDLWAAIMFDEVPS